MFTDVISANADRNLRTYKKKAEPMSEIRDRAYIRRIRRLFAAD